jgi:protein-S-isoprenylcysteine O-methyltransferase Ste14
VRHPFYLAYTLNWLGAAVAARHWAAWLGLAAMLGFYGAAAAQEERKFLLGPLADNYTAYRRRAGTFLPKIFRPPNLNQQQIR